MNEYRLPRVLISGMLLIAGCTTRQPMITPSPLETQIKRFAPTVISAETGRLSSGNRKALAILVHATKLMDRIFLRQSWGGSESLLGKLSADTSREGRLMLHYFMINMGPWSKLDRDSVFIPGVPPRTEGANYYPGNMAKQEFLTWADGLTPEGRQSATGFFTCIRRDRDGKLIAVPYNEEYRDVLEPAAGLLRDAAASTDNPTLRRFLLKRADAFLSNNYYESDLAWMDLDSPLDVTIGPYETYMDGLFNYKAAFEAYIGVRDEDASAKLSFFVSHLQDIENHLPIDPQYRNPHLGALAPISVIDEVAIGGEAREGVQTAAFNLPNDERIVQERGSKRVMLKNVQEAKFNRILKPIAAISLDSAQQSLVSFDPFFTHILAHELMHGLGPHAIRVAGRATTVRQELKELYSSWEEAKADIAGLFALQYLVDVGALDKSTEEQMYVTYLAGVFRSVRFGISEAHGRGMAMQFNFLADQGAVNHNEAKGTFSINLLRMKEAVRALTGIIMTVQAQGDYTAAKHMLDQFATVRPTMQKVLDRLSNVPVDIAPTFPLAE